MSIFGWSYPPGAANDPFAPYNQEDPPCQVCGQFEDQCICPECPQCGGVGYESCYKDSPREKWHSERDGNGIRRRRSHGMKRTQAQIDSLAAAEAHFDCATKDDHV